MDKETIKKLKERIKEVYSEKPQIRNVLLAILNEPTIAKHIYGYSWVSGSTTEVHPLTIWRDGLSIQMDTRKNYFEKAIVRVLEKHSDIFCEGWFNRHDGSCPATIWFNFTDEYKGCQFQL